MGTTANRQIPYVEPADALNAYPAAMKAQSERLDALLPLAVGAWSQGTAQSIPNNTPTRTVLDTVLVPPVGMSIAGNAVTVTVAGLYLVTGSVTYDTNATGFRMALLVVNGASVTRFITAAGAGGPISCTPTRLLQLAAGDVITMNAQHTAGAALTLNTSTGGVHLDVAAVG
jgi:hypothetical protein